MISPDGTWKQVVGANVKVGAYDMSEVTWRAGYFTATGSISSSTRYIRCLAIRAGTFNAGDILKLSAWGSYYLWVTEFIDDGSSAPAGNTKNFVRHWPKMPDFNTGDYVQTTEVPYNPEHAYVVSFGRFDTTTEYADHIANKAFLAAIQCEILRPSEPYYRVTISGNTMIGPENLVCARIERSLFPHDYPEVGNIASERFTFTTKGLEQLQANLSLNVFIQAISSANPTLKTSTVLLGNFIINSVSHKHGSDEYQYDCAPIPLFSGEDIAFDENAWGGAFPVSTSDAYKRLCELAGVDYDPYANSLMLGMSYSIPNYGRFENAVMCEDMLRMIGAAYGGNWVRVPYRKSSTEWGIRLKLVQMFGTVSSDPIDSTVTDIGKKALNIESALYGKKYTGAQIYDDGDPTYLSGNTSGDVLSATVRFGSAFMATNLLRTVNGLTYNGIIATGAQDVTPILFVGDKIIIDDVRTVVNTQIIDLGLYPVQTVGAKLPTANRTEQKNAAKTPYATKQSLGDGSSVVDFKEITAESIVIRDPNGNEYRLSLKEKSQATHVLGF